MADVGVEADLQKIHARTMEKYGGIDILLNNAGMIEMCMLEELTYESFERVLRINTWSGIGLAQLCRWALREADNGVIVNIASDDVLYPSTSLPEGTNLAKMPKKNARYSSSFGPPHWPTGMNRQPEHLRL